MRLRRLLTLLGAATVAVAACSDSSALPHGQGWQVVAERGNGNFPSLTATRNPDGDLSIVAVVSGGCPPGGPNTPQFAGFEPTPDGLAALVSRSPLPPGGAPCLINSGVEFDVLLDAENVPTNAETIVLGGAACPPGDTVCTAVSASISH
jgi:hypothetical protein